MLWSWLSAYEAVVLTAVTVVGFSKAYEVAGGDANPDFVAEFTCLYVPVSVTTLPLVWGAFWAITLGFREANGSALILFSWLRESPYRHRRLLVHQFARFGMAHRRVLGRPRKAALGNLGDVKPAASDTA